MNTFEHRLVKAIPLNSEQIDTFEVKYLPRDIMGNFFGYALQNRAYVRADLPLRVRNFVVKHELYHLRDKRSWLGWIGSEVRANVVCGARDPIGLLLTIITSVRPYRLRTYWKLLLSSTANPRT